MLEGVITWAEIDLDAIQHNVRAIRHLIGPKVEMFAVVKGNAYGHGMAPVARATLQAGANRLAVHRATEGFALRQAGLDAPILVMGYTPASGASAVVQQRLTPSIITIEFARALSAAAQQAGQIVPVHLKVDTGMNRFGLLPDETVEFARAVKCLPGLFLEGIFTHFGTADWADQHFALQQLLIFRQVLSDLQAAGIETPLIHAASSAAIAHLPEARFNAVRPGISMFGIQPSAQLPAPFDLRLALSLKSRISRVRELPKGSAISYNRTFITDRPIRAALVPIGYGDGYPRAFSNSGHVLIRGQRARVLGLVCMDQVIVDITHIPAAKQDDEVVVIGRQENQEITAQELAVLAGTVPNEILTSISSRVVRYYSKDRKPVAPDRGQHRAAWDAIG